MRASRPGGALLVPALAGALPSLDTSVNIALPAISSAFALDVGEVSWIVVSYVLTYSALLLGCGRLADRVGHRRVLMAGLLLSLVGLAACGAAPSFPFLVLARMVQGAGAGLLLASAPALVTLAVTPADRSRALATFQLCTAVGFALGPPVGGLVLGPWGWPGVWWYRVPVAGALLALVALGVVRGRRHPDRRTRDDVRPVAVPLDLPGVATLAIALAGVLLALSRGRELGWGSPLIVGSAAVGLLAAVAFVAIERSSPAPLIDLDLFRRPGFAVANGLNLAANASWFVIFLLVPYYLLTVRGLGPVAGGAILAATPVGMAVAAPLAGRLAVWVPLGPLCAGGLAVEAAGLAAMSRLGAATAIPLVVAPMVLVGVGVGLFQVPNQSFVMGSIPRSAQGVAAGITQTVRTVGVLVGVAGAGTLLGARQAAYRPPAGLPADATAVADASFLAAFGDVLLAAAATAAVAAVVALLRSRATPEPGPPAPGGISGQSAEGRKRRRVIPSGP